MGLLMRGHSFQTAARVCLALGCLHWRSQVSRDNGTEEEEDTPVSKWSSLSQKLQIVKDMWSYLKKLQQAVTRKTPYTQTPLWIRIYSQFYSEFIASKEHLMVTS